MARNSYSHSTKIVARELLGKYLVRKQGRKVERYRIVETEAYVGPQDKASHAHRGRTKRNEVMFGPPGHWYVYFTYGMHHMLNIVTGPEGYPAAVLIRGIEQIYGPRRSIYRLTRSIIGPGRLTKALGITLTLNRKKAAPASGLWIEDSPSFAKATKGKGEKIITTPRVGVGCAGEWATKPLRFVLHRS